MHRSPEGQHRQARRGSGDDQGVRGPADGAVFAGGRVWYCGVKKGHRDNAQEHRRNEPRRRAVPDVLPCSMHVRNQS